MTLSTMLQKTVSTSNFARAAWVQLVVFFAFSMPNSAFARGHGCYGDRCGSAGWLVIVIVFGGIYFAAWGNRPAQDGPSLGASILYFMCSIAAGFCALWILKDIVKAPLSLAQLIGVVTCLLSFYGAIRPARWYSQHPDRVRKARKKG